MDPRPTRKAARRRVHTRGCVEASYAPVYTRVPRGRALRFRFKGSRFPELRRHSRSGIGIGSQRIRGVDAAAVQLLLPGGIETGGVSPPVAHC